MLLRAKKKKKIKKSEAYLEMSTGASECSQQLAVSLTFRGLVYKGVLSSFPVFVDLQHVFLCYMFQALNSKNSSWAFLKELACYG